jgi:hypothetical protein
MNAPAVAATRSPALQQVLDDLEAERYRPVPPPPPTTSAERDTIARRLALLAGEST